MPKGIVKSRYFLNIKLIPQKKSNPDKTITEEIKTKKPTKNVKIDNTDLKISF